MAIKRFRRGLSTFVCQTCKRRTRETNGDHAQTGNCSWCFDLAGIENAISDNGEEVIGDYYEEARALLKRIVDAGGDMTWWKDLTGVLDVWQSRRTV